MLPELNAAIASIKVGYNIVKGFNDLKTDYDIKSATSDLLASLIEAQNNLFSIQSSYQSLLNSKGELETEIKNLKDWERTKLNYSLSQIAPSIFVYISKKYQESPNNEYWLCTNCFNTKNQKSIIQCTYLSRDEFICPSCGFKFRLPSNVNLNTHEETTPIDPQLIF